MRQYGMSQEEAENAKRSGGLPDSYEAEILRPFLENLALEVQRAMHSSSPPPSSTASSTYCLPAARPLFRAGGHRRFRSQVNTRVANRLPACRCRRASSRRSCSSMRPLDGRLRLAMRRFDP